MSNHAVRVRNVTAGALTHDGEEYPIRDGQITGLDAATANDLVDTHAHVSHIGGAPAPRSDSEGDADEAAPDDEPTCAGNDGDCSRDVDEAGEYCWQHEPATDED